jgi:hypothetical protein
MEVSGQLHDPTALSPRKKALDAHWIGSWCVGATEPFWTLKRGKKLLSPAED